MVVRVFWNYGNTTNGKMENGKCGQWLNGEMLSLDGRGNRWGVATHG